ncbi:MAG: hypothetical protein V7603_3297 [Micromonosporaceae bacterium]
MVFGATGMVGQGVLRECLLDPEIEGVLAVGRRATGVADAKLREIVREDLFDLSPVADELAGYDACFFCLGVSSAGMSEQRYRRVTYDLTLAVARILAERSPGMTFVYVSGMGTDSSERGRSMWARVKGATENALLKLPLEAYLFRPGYIQPMHGATTRARGYRLLYMITTPLYPVLRRLAPGQVTTTERLGRAMINVARAGAPSRILAPRDINAAAA